jgi:hypothetical protein
MSQATDAPAEAESLEFVLDFWDTPIEGIAVRGDQAYYFLARFDDERDTYSEVYEVTPVTESTRCLSRIVAQTWRNIRETADDPKVRVEWRAMLTKLRETILTDQLQHVTQQIVLRFVRINGSATFEEAFRIIWPDMSEKKRSEC